MQRYLNNILWLFVDKAVLLVGGMVVSIIVARYLGPEDLGVLSLGLTLSILPVIISQLGGGHIIFNRSAKSSRSAELLITSTTMIRALIHATVSIIVILYIFFFSDYIEPIVLSLIIVFSIFLGLDNYQFYFNGILSSKTNAVSSMISRLVSMTLRVVLVLLKYQLIFFVIPYLINNLVLYFLRRKEFNKNLQISKINKKKSLKYKKYWLKASMPLIVSAISIFIYGKIAEIVIANKVSIEYLGFYTAACTLAMAWQFIPLSLGTTLLTRVLKERDIKKIEKGLSFIYLVQTITCIPIIIFTLYFSTEIIEYTYGNDYSISSSVLPIICSATYLSSLGFITNRIITSNGGAQYLMYKVMISSIFAFILSNTLVDKYGLEGIAFSVVIIEFLNLTLFNFLFGKVKIFRSQLGTFLSLGYLKAFKE